MITVTFLPNAYWKHIGIGFHSWFLSGQQMSDNKQESITVNHQENILDTVGRDTWRWYIKSKLDQNHYKFLKFAESLTALSDTFRNVVEDSQQNFCGRQSSMKTNLFLCVETIFIWRLISIPRKHVL